MTAVAPSRIEKSRSTDNAWLFLSPHLDDAVLSCGALIESEARKRKVLVTTLFTEAGPVPHTHAARSFLGQCSAHDADSLFKARRREDMAVLSGLGVDFLHLGATDALFRRRVATLPGSSILGRALPELVHRYPTYRFDIALGRVSRGDAALIGELRATVADLIEASNAELVFCPIGVGRHVDHLITRMVGEEFPEQVVFYADFPYNVSSEPDQGFISKKRLTPWLWNDGTASKHERVRQYKTQTDALFPEGHIPAIPETYYV